MNKGPRGKLYAPKKYDYTAAQGGWLFSPLFG